VIKTQKSDNSLKESILFLPIAKERRMPHRKVAVSIVSLRAPSPLVYEFPLLLSFLTLWVFIRRGTILLAGWKSEGGSISTGAPLLLFLTACLRPRLARILGSRRLASSRCRCRLFAALSSGISSAGMGCCLAWQ